MSAFWNRFKKEEGQKAVGEKKQAGLTVQKIKKSEEDVKVKSKKPKKIEDYREKADLVNKTILQPVISEDAMKKESLGKYVFKVGRKIPKKQIAKAMEAKYQVEVRKVNVLNYKSKSHNF